MWHTATLIPCLYAHAQIKHFTSYESDNGAKIKPRSTIALWHVATQIPCPYAHGLSKSNLRPQACSIIRLYDIIVTNLKRSPLFTLSNYAILLCKMHYQIENVDVPPKNFKKKKKLKMLKILDICNVKASLLFWYHKILIRTKKQKLSFYSLSHHANTIKYQSIT